MIQKYLELYKQGENTIPERFELLVVSQKISQQKLKDLMEQVEIINDKVETNK